MSYDFNNFGPCNHIIRDETANLSQQEPDKLAFRFKLSEFINLKINGSFVPSSGLYSAASLTFLNSPPYRIEKNKNDLLQIKIGSDLQIVSIELPPGNISGKVLQKYLERQFIDRNISSISVSLEENRINFKGNNLSSNIQFTFPDPRWVDKTSSLSRTLRILSTYKTLGILPGRVCVGNLIYPGYSVVDNIIPGILEQPGIKFNSTIRNANPNITYSYKTYSNVCPICLGSGYSADYSTTTINTNVTSNSINNSLTANGNTSNAGYGNTNTPNITGGGGTLSVVTGTSLLIQEANRHLFTLRGSHWKWGWLGSTVATSIGSKALPGTPALLSQQLSDAFVVYRDIKRQQEQNFPDQNVTDEEYPASIESFKLTYDDNDPTVLNAEFVVKARSSTLSNVSTITNGTTIYTLNTNAASGNILREFYPVG